VGMEKNYDDLNKFDGLCLLERHKYIDTTFLIILNFSQKT
jgi:hypothetical protein